MQPILTYVITTYNKLNYLKIVVNELLNHKSDDEEIIVIDGSSNDGTKDYLEDLFMNKKIDTFVSEPDLGEAHGFNKGMLLSKGKLIKFISDDDFFDYKLIKKMKQYMIENIEIDVVASNLADFFPYLSNEIHVNSSNEDYLLYKNNSKPFSFCGLSLMLKKSSLSKIGLFNTKFIAIDSEYTMRITNDKRIKFVWFDNVSVVRIDNGKDSNFNKFYYQILEENLRLNLLYGLQTKQILSQMKIFNNRNNFLLRLFSKKLRNDYYYHKNNNSKSNVSFNELFNNSKEWLTNHNKNKQIIKIL